MLRYLFYYSALVGIVFGIAFLFFPQTLSSTYGAPLDDTTILVGRYFGSTLLPLAFLAWVASAAPGSALKLAVVRMSAASQLLGLIIAVLAMSAGTINATGGGINIILEGDWRSAGLRFTGPACNIGGAGGGGSTITAASATSLTYNYANPDYCGDGARTSHTVVVAYDSANHVITRTIDGGTAINIPDYATADAGIKLDPPSGVSFFRYYNNAGSEMKGAGINTAAIYQVDVTLISSSGSGVVQNDAGQTQLKSGVDIKRYVAAPAACWTTGTVCTLDSQCCSGSCL